MLEFERVQQPLERAAVMAPRVSPFDRKGIVDAADAALAAKTNGDL